MPSIHIQEDLNNILSKWKSNRDKIILFIDANQNLARGKLENLFKKDKMRDPVKSYTS